MLPVGDGALYGEKMEGTNREGHEGLAKEAYFKSGNKETGRRGMGKWWY